jgi:hypothetical protein
MNSFQERNLKYYVAELSARIDKFSLLVDEKDAENVVRNCIRKLDALVSYPRLLVLNSPGRSTTLPETVDTIVNVKFSNEHLDVFIKEFGLLPLVARSLPMGSLEAASEFLILKGNINMLSRHLKFAPDWEFYPPEFIINNYYRHVVVEYLPHLDGDLNEWLVNSIENTYIMERAEALLHRRNAEALVSASYLGVGTEYSTVLTHWDTKVKEIDEQFQKSGVITYLG